MSDPQIRNAVVNLINDAIDRRMNAGLTCELPALPMPDGTMVTAERATPAQWEAAADYLTSAALDVIEQRVEELVKFSLARSRWMAEFTRKGGAK
jgi:hypothetical protein